MPTADATAPFRGCVCMDDRILIVYATRFGSTGLVAENVAEALSAKEISVDIRAVSDAPDPSAYRAVVLGTPIYWGRPLSEARDFLRKHSDALSRMPLAYFAVGTERNHRRMAGYLKSLRKILEPADVGAFEGVLDYGKLNLFEKLVMWLLRHPGGDHRDVAAIHAWANDLRPVLLGARE